MSSQIGSLNIIDFTNGYWLRPVDNGPDDWTPEVSGVRVLIPGRAGEFTPATAPFEDRRLIIRYHGFVTGAGATHALAQASFATRMAALKTACDVAGREDVTLLEGEWTAQAGFLRFEGPSSDLYGGEAREFDIVFEATDPPEWTAS